MTDQTIITLVAAIPTTIAAIGALWVSIHNAKKADTLIAKSDVIHTLANDNLSKATNALAVANETIKGFQAQVASMASAKKDAQDVAMKQAEPAPKP